MNNVKNNKNIFKDKIRTNNVFELNESESEWDSDTAVSWIINNLGLRLWGSGFKFRLWRFPEWVKFVLLMIENIDVFSSYHSSHRLIQNISFWCNCHWAMKWGWHIFNWILRVLLKVMFLKCCAGLLGLSFKTTLNCSSQSILIAACAYIQIPERWQLVLQFSFNVCDIIFWHNFSWFFGLSLCTFWQKKHGFHSFQK